MVVGSRGLSNQLKKWQSGCNLYHCTCVHSVYTSPVSSGYQIEAPLSSQVRTAHSKSIQQVLYITKPHQEVSQGFIGMNHNKSDSFIEEPLLTIYHVTQNSKDKWIIGRIFLYIWNVRPGVLGRLGRILRLAAIRHNHNSDPPTPQQAAAVWTWRRHETLKGDYLCVSRFKCPSPTNKNYLLYDQNIVFYFQLSILYSLLCPNKKVKIDDRID